MWLIIGAGYIGERVADYAHLAGQEVVCVTSNPDSAERLNLAKPYQSFAADVGVSESLQALKSTLPKLPQRILHCASSGRGGAAAYERVFLLGSQNLHKAFPEADLAFTSSSSVYPQTDGSWVDETSDASPTTQTSQILRQTEDFLLPKGGLIARLSGIYGPHRSHPLKQFLSQTAVIEGNNFTGKYLNQIHREDAARALVHLMKLKATGIYNVSDSTPLTQLEFFQYLAKKFELPLPETSEIITQRKRAWTHKKVSNAKLLATGFTCQFTSFFDALENDPALLPSILAQISS